MRKIASLLSVLMLVTALAYAQVRTVTGRVTDPQGKAVPFATISVKGTNNGTAADESGNFSIQAAPGSTLVFSAAGYQTSEINIGSQSTVNASLSSQSTMNEVVVTALGLRRTRNQVPYAAQQLTGDEVSKERTSNFVQSLSGKVSGLEIRQTNTLGGSTNVVIRGYKSLTGTNQALFVVDGVPFDNSNTNTTNQRTGRGGYDYGSSSADINPDDIESITVLKGAAATALYGSRAANGVILITTKKGRRGLGITVNSGVTFGAIDKSTFTTYQHSYGANYGYLNGYGSPDGNFLYFDVNGDGTPDLVTPTTEDASWGAKFDPNLMVYQWDAFDKTSPNYLKARPWLAATNDPTTYWEKPVNFNNSVFIDGGSDKGTFKLGYTRTDDKGILPNSSIVKNMIDFASSYNITNNLTAAASINYSRIDGKGRYGTGYDTKNPATNFRQWWETNVDVQELKDAYFRTKQNITWNWADPSDTVNGLVPIYWDNPYWDRYENYETDSRSRLFGWASMNYKPVSWLNFMGRASVDGYDEIQEERIAIGSLDVPQYSRFNRSYREYNYDLLANFDKNISPDFNVKALLGMNIRKQNVSSIYASTNGGLVVPHLYSLSNSANPINAPIESVVPREVDGVFAGGTVSWRDKITLDGTIRRDKSSTLPENNNVYYYPSVSLGYVFAKDLTNLPWLSYGKLRANYAEVGNDAPPLSTNTTYSNPRLFNGSATDLITSYEGNPLFVVNTTQNNPELKPERTKSYEFGLEAALLKNRLGFDVTYYNAKSVNQILPVAVSNATGLNFKYVNAGTIENKGWEVTLYGTPVKTQNFSWNINVNWTRNRNKVTELFQGSDNLVLASYQGGVSINATLGQPYGTIRGSDFVYTDGQKTVKANGYYQITSTSNNIIGNANPDWIGGINNTLRYKNLALSFLIDMRQGGDVFSLDMYYGLATGLYPETAGNNDLGNPVRNTLAQGGGIINQGVTADGKANTKRVDISGLFGAYGYYRNPAAAFVYDASYVKLREASLTYSLPNSVMSKLHGFKGIDLSLIGRNLWIIHKNLPYADPEESISSGNSQGYQGGSYPTTRTIGFNIRLTF
jgi:TonB-linked SusC/RagA family outer membrane protein